MIIFIISIGAMKFAQTYQTLLHLNFSSLKITKEKNIQTPNPIISLAITLIFQPYFTKHWK
jgi:hypothetical protein